MNMLTLVVILIFLICLVAGYRRGLVKSVIKIIFAGVSLMLAYFLTPLTGDLLTQNTKVDEFIKRKVNVAIESTVKEKLEKELNKDEKVYEESEIEEMVQVSMQSEPTKNEQINQIYNIKVPAFVREALIENNYDEMHKLMDVKGFYDYVSTYITRMIVNCISFWLTFILIGLVSCIVYLVMAVVVKLPIISGINKFGGLIFGLLQSLVIVWSVFMLAMLFDNTEIGIMIVNQIEESKLLTFVNKHNIFVIIVENIVRMI